MDTDKILEQVDRYFNQKQGAKAEQLLKSALEQAAGAEDENAQLVLVNELIGYYRETSRNQEAFCLAEEVLRMLEHMNLKGTVPYGTTLLNIANAYRAGGRLEEALRLYDETEQIYREWLDEKDMLLAGLYNNRSLVYQEKGEYGCAKEWLLKALAVTRQNPGARFEMAVTWANLASTCLKLEEDEDAAGYFTRAIALFEELGVEDAHYGAALSSLGAYHYKRGEYEKAARCFRRAMEEMRRTFGENEYYERLKENLRLCEEAGSRGGKREKYHNGMELARAYYEKYGRPMIREQFPEYEDKIAAGLVGEGSDCFGWDDALSRDHDWGPDFCLWISEETDTAVGEALRKAYEQLPQEFGGYVRRTTQRGAGRRGVCTVPDFYRRLLGCEEYEQINWGQVQDAALAACVNGEVFRDEEGLFMQLRKRLAQGYPEDVLYLRLAQSSALFSQTGQYNYGRVLARGDRTTAAVMLGDCMREAMKLCYYLDGDYPPHDKWLRRGLKDRPRWQKLCAVLDRIVADCGPDSANQGRIMENASGSANRGRTMENASGSANRGRTMEDVSGSANRGRTMEDVSGNTIREWTAENAPGYEIKELIEEAGRLLAFSMYEAGWISDTDPYLESHTEELLRKASFCKMTVAELTREIAELEFKAFDQVENEGGRASCQDDWETFSIMRKSQYLTWSREMLCQYLYDFGRALSGGHNLIAEKYGRMMESTAPEEYERIKDRFPVLDEGKKAVIEAIVGIQVGWMEEFAAHYPGLAGKTRRIRTSEDRLFDTSFETYLRGEISTYSDKMLELYGRYVAEYAKTGRNLTCEIMLHSARMYGYASLEEADLNVC